MATSKEVFERWRVVEEHVEGCREMNRKLVCTKDTQEAKSRITHTHINNIVDTKKIMNAKDAQPLSARYACHPNFARMIRRTKLILVSYYTKQNEYIIPSDDLTHFSSLDLINPTRDGNMFGDSFASLQVAHIAFNRLFKVGERLKVKPTESFLSFSS